MQNVDRDKVIAEALGLCWHDYMEPAKGCASRAMCKKCRKNRNKPSDFNPDFSTADAMLLILKLGPERRWWRNFMLRLDGLKVHVWYGLYYINADLLQDPNRIADELKQFLDEGRGGK